MGYDCITVMAKILITGASGLLGSNLGVALARKHDVAGVYNQHPITSSPFATVACDLSDPNLVRQLGSLEPDCIIHAAGEANVDVCEANPEYAEKAILESARNIAGLADFCGAYLLFISTDAVFNGDFEYATERDTPTPVNVYGKLKVRSEHCVLESTPRSAVVRTRFYGWNPGHKHCFAEHVIDNLRRNRTIECFTDNYSTQVVVYRLGDIFMELFSKDFRGLIHIAEDKKFSRFEFAERVAEVFDLDKSLIIPASLGMANLKAPRPADTSLCSDLAASMLQTQKGDIFENLTLMKNSTNPVVVG